MSSSSATNPESATNAAARGSRLLSEDEISRQLVDLPGVLRQGAETSADSLRLSVRTPSFPDAVRLVTLVAQDAETMNHHPDIDIRWRTVTFVLSTHSLGGVTQLDIELAHQIRSAAETVGGTIVNSLA